MVVSLNFRIFGDGVGASLSKAFIANSVGLCDVNVFYIGRAQLKKVHTGEVRICVSNFSCLFRAVQMLQRIIISFFSIIALRGAGNFASKK